MLLKLIEICREMLFRIERRLIECHNTTSTSKGQFDGATEKIINGQNIIKENIKHASKGIHLDMERLLGICIGLAVGVDRLDKRQIHLRKELLHSRNLARRQDKSLVSIERTVCYLQIYAGRIYTIVGQLLQL
jgi:hypothetical protein